MASNATDRKGLLAALLRRSTLRRTIAQASHISTESSPMSSTSASGTEKRLSGETLRQGILSSSCSQLKLCDEREFPEKSPLIPASALQIDIAAPAAKQINLISSIQTTTGTWKLGKTIGAGSIGKVKLGTNEKTGQLVAIKIIQLQSPEYDLTVPGQEYAESDKRVRLMRKFAILKCIHHPHICALQDYSQTNNHWYLLLEYVDGGDLLDYLISYGRVKEKKARKWSRQLASALDYCHRNNIVHRNLKIENIKLTKDGDIKLIGFFWSNLYSPQGVLRTSCGTGYYTAPEIFEGKVYVGPEIDIYSFGVIIYIVVCGKVPFDAADIPTLRQLMIKGDIELPWWVSTQCKRLLLKMMEVNPLQRATLSDVMNHPWMMKGYKVQIDNFLPPRTPLVVPLDLKVIRNMNAFGFGDPSSITQELEFIIGSGDSRPTVQSTKDNADYVSSESNGEA